MTAEPCLDNPPEAGRETSDGGWMLRCWRILTADPRPAATRKMEGAVFIAACLALAWFHVVLFQNSGSVWRDETGAIQIASAPSWTDLWSWLSRDSAPVAFYAALRAWMSGTAWAGETGVRFIGLLVSAGIVASLWISCRMMTGRAPLAAAALVPFNSAIFYFCASVRPYGLAVLFIMPCCAAFWRLAQQATPKTVLAALLLAMLACHTSYQNSYLLLAIGVAGATACATRRLWFRGLLILGIGFAVAVSLLVYVPAIRDFEESCRIMNIAPKLASFFFSCLLLALGSESLALACVWGAAALLGASCLVASLAGRRGPVDSAPSLAVYVATLAVTAAAAAFGFVLAHGIIPFVWHLTPLVAVLGLMIDAAIRTRDDKTWVWMIHAGLACLAIGLSFPILLHRAHLRRTNMDQVAAVLAREAKPDDFVLVNPFWFATGFKYHYHGDAPWNTLPLTSTDTYACLLPYGPIRRTMTMPDPLVPTLEIVEKTLKSGHRIWIAGDLQIPRPNLPLPSLPPAPYSKYGWSCLPYYRSWMWQVGRHLKEHAVRFEHIPVPVDGEISPVENVRLWAAAGWRENGNVLVEPSGEFPKPMRPTGKEP